MIWVLAGTGDSFRLIDKLIEYKTDILASVVTDYGEKKLADKNIKIIKDSLDISGMIKLIKKYNIELIIDATHPFAEVVSQNAIEAGQNTDTKYIRFEREAIDLSHYTKEYIISVHSYEEAVVEAAKFENIFLTIGSNNLKYFTSQINDWPQRLTARVLADSKFIKRAENLGFTPANIIAMQGPFSKKLNKILMAESEADVIVSKASGNIGGLDTKIRAAIELKIPIIIIKRPRLHYPLIFNNLEKLIEYCFSGVEKYNE
ncbi:MAG: precorrin-6A reductase [Bacillota bacterium]